MEWVIGIDEVGRGPLAGPIAVGAVALPVAQNDWKFWEGLRDSKQLSEKQREAWYLKLKEAGTRYSVSMVGAEVIDESGLTQAAALAARRSIGRLDLKSIEANVLLDWGLSAPPEWQQEKFVKGDERFPVIALASIAAKVTRDRYMCLMAEKFPGYGFEKHKGYGTSAHYSVIALNGVCSLHRRTFLKK